MSDVASLMKKAYELKTIIPGFNIPYLPMMEPIIAALRDTESFALIEVARLEFIKFDAGSLETIRELYEKHKDVRHTRLHLDHVPVIDEDKLRVDYMPIMKEAIDLGYESVMIDGSRLSLDENIASTREVCELAHSHNVPVEGELGAIAGHEKGPMPPYEELFASGQGFTDVEEAKRFAKETEVDWLSVATGNIHGAISLAKRNEKKEEARLNIEHFKKLQQAVPMPMVLHGGSGIKREYILEAIKNGITKINICNVVRQAHILNVEESPDKARQAVYDQVCQIINEELQIAGNANKLFGS
jgi:fructose-bisphosphate aldolase, class II